MYIKKKKSKDSAKTTTRKNIFIILICVFIALVLVIAIETVLIQPVRTEQNSMYLTIKEDEVILIDKWFGITNKNPSRGDIVMFKVPSKEYVKENEFQVDKVIADYSQRTTTNFLKRVIGLPGEHVKISEEGQVYINGKLLEEEYIHLEILEK